MDTNLGTKTGSEPFLRLSRPPGGARKRTRFWVQKTGRNQDLDLKKSETGDRFSRDRGGVHRPPLDRTLTDNWVPKHETRSEPCARWPSCEPHKLGPAKKKAGIMETIAA